jgi:hypothetical protein
VAGLCCAGVLRNAGIVVFVLAVAAAGESFNPMNDDHFTVRGMAALVLLGAVLVPVGFWIEGVVDTAWRKAAWRSLLLFAGMLIVDFGSGWEPDLVLEVPLAVGGGLAWTALGVATRALRRRFAR